MKTTNIKGKEYVEVNERIKYLRANFTGYSLTSDIISIENGVCIIKAEIRNENGVLVAVGHAYEKEDSTYINKTSYIENCETSAWGRALGNFGIGIDASVASADEVQNAITQQNQKEEPKPAKKKLDAKGLKFLLESGTKDQINQALRDRDVTPEQKTKLNQALEIAK